MGKPLGVKKKVKKAADQDADLKREAELDAAEKAAAKLRKGYSADAPDSVLDTTTAEGAASPDSKSPAASPDSKSSAAPATTTGSAASQTQAVPGSMDAGELTSDGYKIVDDKPSIAAPGKTTAPKPAKTIVKTPAKSSIKPIAKQPSTIVEPKEKTDEDLDLNSKQNAAKADDPQLETAFDAIKEDNNKEIERHTKLGDMFFGPSRLYKLIDRI